MIKRILLVDDEPDFHRLVRLLLESDDREIESCYDGEECLKHVADRPPDLIIIDVMMPKLNGVEAVKRLKKMPGTENIPVIMVTALDNKEYVRAALFRLGVEYYIIKPFDSDDFVGKVNQALHYYNTNSEE